MWDVKIVALSQKMTKNLKPRHLLLQVSAELRIATEHVLRLLMDALARTINVISLLQNILNSVETVLKHANVAMRAVQLELNAVLERTQRLDTMELFIVKNSR